VTVTRVRRWLVILALALGAAAAIAGTPVPAGHVAKAAIYKPPSGC